MTPGVSLGDLLTIRALIEAALAAERGIALTGGPALLGHDVREAADALDAGLLLRVEEEIRSARLQARITGTVTL